MAWARAIRVAFWDTIFRKVHCSTSANGSSYIVAGGARQLTCPDAADRVSVSVGLTLTRICQSRACCVMPSV